MHLLELVPDQLKPPIHLAQQQGAPIAGHLPPPHGIHYVSSTQSCHEKAVFPNSSYLLSPQLQNHS